MGGMVTLLIIFIACVLVAAFAFDVEEAAKEWRYRKRVRRQRTESKRGDR